MIARCEKGHPMRCARVEVDRLGRTVAVTWLCPECAIEARVTARGVTTGPAPRWYGGPDCGSSVDDAGAEGRA